MNMAKLSEHTVNTMVHGFLLEFDDLSVHQKESELKRFIKDVIKLSTKHKPEWLDTSNEDSVYEYESSNAILLF